MYILSSVVIGALHATKMAESMWGSKAHRDDTN